MVSVSLCMIVKDEEAVLSRCLTSVGDFADEIIIVDTGSKDRTKEIAGRFTDKIYDFAWRDDFAAARNFAFEKGTGDYLFWLDADDVIPREELTKLMDLKASLEEPLPDVVMMNYAVGFDESGRPVFSFFRERMIKRGPNAVWQGRIHEVIPPFGTVIKKEITKEIQSMFRPNMTLSISARLMIRLCSPMPSTSPASAPMMVRKIVSRNTYEPTSGS